MNTATVQAYADTREATIAWWKDNLSQCAETTTFPIVRNSSAAVVNAKRACVDVLLSPEAVERFSAITGESAFLRFVLLETALKATLYLHTRSTAHVMLTPALVSGDSIAGTTRDFVPLLSTLQPTSSFKGCLQAERTTALEAYRRQGGLTEHLLEQVMGTSTAGGLGEIAMRSGEGIHAEFSPSLLAGVAITAERQGNRVAIISFPMVFPEHRVCAFAQRWAAVIEQCLLDPTVSLSALSLGAVSIAEYQRGAEVAYALSPIHTAIEQRAAETPDALALSFAGGELSYADLNNRANRLARVLLKQGIGLGDHIALAMERSADFVVAMLASLKTGAAFAPIDLAWSPARKASVLAAIGTKLAITNGCDDVPDQIPSALFSALSRASEGLDSDDLGLPIPLDTPIYTIFTSGSTGVPKAACNSHRAVSNRLQWMQEAFGLRAGERVLHKTPATFDVAMWELMWPLMYGACMVVGDPGLHRDLGALANAINKERIAFAHFVPSVLHAFLQEAKEQEFFFPDLRRIVASGEELKLETSALALSMGISLSNLYGPAEAAIDVSYFHCEQLSKNDDRIPIGRPISNARLYVLDKDLNPLPAGVAGELFIAGSPISHGYINDAAKTAQSFRPDPWAAEPGARMYATGDLAAFREDGQLLFLGRRDGQVKLMGNRIEVGEIETALQACTGVAEALVLFVPEPTPHLAAFCVLKNGKTGVDAAEALRAELAPMIPLAWMPASFAVISQLPRLSSGKIDRRALLSENTASAQRTAPQNERQQQLFDIWSVVLGTTDMGIDDNFFKLGGHSVIATRLIARVNRAFGVNLPLRMVFEYPTMRALADCIAAEATTAHSPNVFADILQAATTPTLHV